jgi:hypothetical protein
MSAGIVIYHDLSITQKHNFGTAEITYYFFVASLESRRRRTKGSVVGEEWCQNAAPLR